MLQVENLCVHFGHANKVHRAVHNVSFSMAPGESLAVVGESGCGKTAVNLALTGLLGKTATATADHLAFRGTNLLGLKPSGWRRIRGAGIAMIFQDPQACLNPCLTLGAALDETIWVHQPDLNRAGRKARALELLEQVGLHAPASRLHTYPHQLSGGMAQRVMIALALACKPALLIADEPTTALDPTLQRQIMVLLNDLRRQHGMALLWVTHDLALAAAHAERVQVMYAGQIVESGPAADVLYAPQHPYTQALLSAMPGMQRASVRQPLKCIAGTVAQGGDPAWGCLFAPRCAKAQPHCHSQQAPLRARHGGIVRCVHASEKI